MRLSVFDANENILSSFVCFQLLHGRLILIRGVYEGLCLGEIKQDCL